MSMSQFNKWLAEHGIVKSSRCYRIPYKGVTQGVEEKERRLSVTLTTGSRDRHGDILEPGGAQIAAYLKNPVVLWAHEYKSLPIGRCTSLVRDGNALKADILFAPTAFAREVYTLYAKGFLRAWSVGFLPLDWDVIENAEKKFSGYHVRAWELIELSAVPIPANAEALTHALDKGWISQPTLVKALNNAIPSEADAASHLDAAGEPDDAGPSEILRRPELARTLASKLLLRLRPCLGDAVGKEIRRQQGRLD